MPNINDPEPPFALTESEKGSTLWKRLEAYLKTRLEECRAKNDGAMDAIQTANMRGQIQTYRSLVDLGKD